MPNMTLNDIVSAQRAYRLKKCQAKKRKKKKKLDLIHTSTSSSCGLLMLHECDISFMENNNMLFDEAAHAEFQ